MEKFKDKYRIQSNRFKGYDYSSDGAYFVTICCKDRECLLGDVVDRGMVLNELGRCVEKCWKEIPEHFTDVILDEFVIMPNHLHGILFLFPSVETKKILSLRKLSKYGTCRTIGSIIRGFKIGVTLYARKKTDIYNVWQSNYYDRIIRNEEELNRIREYIKMNSERWDKDRNKDGNIFL